MAQRGPTSPTPYGFVNRVNAGDLGKHAAMLHRFTYEARKAVYVAQESAAGLGLTRVEPRHLLLGALHGTKTIASQVVAALGVDRDAVCAALSEESAAPRTRGWDMRLSDAAMRVIDVAYAAARDQNAAQFNTGHLLLGVLDDPAICARLELSGVPLTRAAAVVARERLTVAPPETVRPKARVPGPPRETTLQELSREHPVDRTWTPNFPLCFVALVLIWLWRIAVEDLLVVSGVLRLTNVLLSRGWVAATSWEPGLLASVWSAIAAPVLCWCVGYRNPRRWAAIEAFLVCKCAFGLALAVFFALNGAWSPGWQSVTWPEQNVPWVLLAVVIGFRNRETFGVGQKDGWRMLWRQGGWMLGVTALLEAIQLGAIAGLVR